MLIPNYDELVALKNQANPLGLGSKAKVHSAVMGGHSTLFKGRGLDFAECREYSPGDDIRAIDWRVTARMGRAHTKIFTEERERSVFIIVDINSYMEFGTRKTFKNVQAARAAALIAWKAHELHDRIGAILFGHITEKIQVVRPSRSRKAIWAMLKTLSTPGVSPVEVKIEDALFTADRCIPTGSLVFVISDFYKLNPDFEKSLGMLSKRCEVTLVQVTDPSEKDIPEASEVLFSNHQDNRLNVNTNDLKGRDLYRKFWAKKSAALSEISHRLRARLVEVSTDREVSQDLARQETR
jgi:uncharacterized protein (DUF58 family)